VTTADGTAKVIDITIHGANDAATISGTATGSVTEKRGFGNAIPGVATATGDLDAADVDSATTFQLQTNVAQSYGTFSILSTGAWTYTLDDNNADVQALDVGDTLHGLVTVAAADGTTRQIDITINGAGDTGFDLTYVTPSLGFVIQGDAAEDGTGSSVSAAGDVNGDGFVDLIVGAPFGNDGGSNAGEAYVVFGKAAGLGTVDGSGRAMLDLTSLSPADGFVIQDDVTGDNAGWSVSAAGDINGDGFADVIIGAPGGDDGGNYAGEAYVVFGGASGLGTLDGAGRSVVDLASFSPAQGFIVRGDAAGDATGIGVSSAGDVNGDGLADLIVGASLGDDGGDIAGEAYVVFGKASGFGTVDGTGRSVVDLTSLSPANGFVIQGDAAGDEAGYSLSSAGDVNGDGIADLIVGARGGDDGGSNAGEAYVVFGTTSGFGTVDGTGRSVVDLTTLAAANGFVVQGDEATDWAGLSVSKAGDVNGDGFADIIVGAPLGADAGVNAGEAYVVFRGAPRGFGIRGRRGPVGDDLTALAPDRRLHSSRGDVAGNSVRASMFPRPATSMETALPT
jgi:VCBS repeat-containing protein